jgi:hypothetical protein
MLTNAPPPVLRTTAANTREQNMQAYDEEKS